MNEGTLGQNQRPCHTFEPGAPWDQAEQPAYIGKFESYVDEHVVGRFIQLAPRRVLEMARKGEIQCRKSDGNKFVYTICNPVTGAPFGAFPGLGVRPSSCRGIETHYRSRLCRQLLRPGTRSSSVAGGSRSDYGDEGITARDLDVSGCKHWCCCCGHNSRLQLRFRVSVSVHSVPYL